MGKIEFSSVLSLIQLSSIGEHDLPPSYNAAMGMEQPSAPVMPGGGPPLNPGWNPNLMQAQPVIPQQQYAQPQFIAQHFEAPAAQSKPKGEQNFSSLLRKSILAIVVISQQIQLGADPVEMFCPSCQKQTVTKIEYESNLLTYGLCLVLCFIWWV